jgi:hypothetical protein
MLTAFIKRLSEKNENFRQEYKTEKLEKRKEFGN